MDILPEYDGAGEQKVEHRDLQSSNVDWKEFAVGDGRPAAENKIKELPSSIKQHIYLGLKSILYSRPILPLPHCYTILQTNYRSESHCLLLRYRLPLRTKSGEPGLLLLGSDRWD